MSIHLGEFYNRPWSTFQLTLVNIFVYAFDQVEQFLLFILAGWWRCRFFVAWQRVPIFGRLTLRVAHREHGAVGGQTKKSVLEHVATIVPSEDASHLPKLYVVQEFTSSDSDFTHEQLIEVVGAQEFFLPPSLSSPFGSSAGML